MDSTSIAGVIKKGDRLQIMDLGKADDSKETETDTEAESETTASETDSEEKTEIVTVASDPVEDESEIFISGGLKYAHNEGALVKRIHSGANDIEELGKLRIDTITARTSPRPTEGIEADLLFHNDVPLDEPSDKNSVNHFGKYPGLHDTFYIASEEAFSKGGADITLSVKIVQKPIGEWLDERLDRELASALTGPKISPSEIAAKFKHHGWSFAELEDVSNDSHITDAIKTLKSGSVTDAQAQEILTQLKERHPAKTPVLSWEYWDGNGWSVIKGVGYTGRTEFRDGVTAVEFKCPMDTKATSVVGQESYWIRVRIVDGNYGSEVSIEREQDTWVPDRSEINYLRMEKLRISYNLSKAFDLQHCLISNNLASQNITQKSRARDDVFQPFQPLKDETQTLHLGFDKQLLKGPISLFFSLEEQWYPEENRPRIEWYYYAKGDKWTRLEVVDGTDDLTRSGTIRLLGPSDFVSASLFGKKRYWLKAVDTKNNFQSLNTTSAAQRDCCSPSPIKLANLKDPAGLVHKLKNMADPLSKHLCKQFSSDTRRELDGCKNGAPSARLQRSLVWELNKTIRCGCLYARQHIAHLSLSDKCLKLIKQRPCGMEASLNRMVLDAAYGDEIESVKPCAEDTSAFSSELMLPGDISPAPEVKGIYVNATWALQGATIRDEILGSSNGEQSQVFRLVQPPVISETIQVNEMGSISGEEKQKLVTDKDEKIENEGEKTISETRDDTGETTEIWVRWEKVDDFLDSGDAHRHYVINPISGQVQFGDGNSGMIPPIGRDNIRATYQWGGGKAGNVKAQEIQALKSSIPSVEAVSNPEPAGAGSDTETMKRVLERGPQFLRNRGRAVTIEDYEWIAKDASPDIARAKCLPNYNAQGGPQPGCVTVIIVPESNEEKPVPSPLLIRKVKKYLADRCSNVVVSADRLQVVTPTYIKVSVTAELYLESIDSAANAESEAIGKLKSFLHPLSGGADGNGWEFGRMTCFSDLYAVLEEIAEVDHVDNLSMKLEDGKQEMTFSSKSLIETSIPPYALIYSGEHKLTPAITSGATNGGKNS